MRVAVSVMPCLFVSIVPAGRDQSIEHFRQVSLQSRFELNGTDGGCAAHVEYMNRSGMNAGSGDDCRDLMCKIVQVAVPAGANGNLMLMNHAFAWCRRFYPWMAATSSSFVALKLSASASSHVCWITER